MNYDKQLQALVDVLNEESKTVPYRLNRARKYDYIEKKIFGKWQKTAAVVKDLDSKVSRGYIRTRIGDIVELQGNTPKRGSKFVKGTIFTTGERLGDAFHNGSLVSFAPDWFRSEYKSRTPNSKR